MQSASEGELIRGTDPGASEKLRNYKPSRAFCFDWDNTITSPMMFNVINAAQMQKSPYRDTMSDAYPQLKAPTQEKLAIQLVTGPKIDLASTKFKGALEKALREYVNDEKNLPINNPESPANKFSQLMTHVIEQGSGFRLFEDGNALKGKFQEIVNTGGALYIASASDKVDGMKAVLNDVLGKDLAGQVQVLGYSGRNPGKAQKQVLHLPEVQNSLNLGKEDIILIDDNSKNVKNAITAGFSGIEAGAPTYHGAVSWQKIGALLADVDKEKCKQDPQNLVEAVDKLQKSLIDMQQGFDKAITKDREMFAKGAEGPGKELAVQIAQTHPKEKAGAAKTSPTRGAVNPAFVDDKGKMGAAAAPTSQQQRSQEAPFTDLSQKKMGLIDRFLAFFTNLTGSSVVMAKKAGGIDKIGGLNYLDEISITTTSSRSIMKVTVDASQDPTSRLDALVPKMLQSAVFNGMANPNDLKYRISGNSLIIYAGKTALNTSGGSQELSDMLDKKMTAIAEGGIPNYKPSVMQQQQHSTANERTPLIPKSEERQQEFSQKKEEKTHQSLEEVMGKGYQPRPQQQAKEEPLYQNVPQQAKEEPLYQNMEAIQQQARAVVKEHGKALKQDGVMASSGSNTGKSAPSTPVPDELHKERTEPKKATK